MVFDFSYKQFIAGYYYSSSKIIDENNNLLGYYRVQEFGDYIGKYQLIRHTSNIRVSFTWAKDGRADFSREMISLESPIAPASVLVEETLTKKIRTMNELLLAKVKGGLND